MKITEKQLRKIINEELNILREESSPAAIDSGENAKLKAAAMKLGVSTQDASRISAAIQKLGKMPEAERNAMIPKLDSVSKNALALLGAEVVFSEEGATVAAAQQLKKVSGEQK